MPTLAIWEGRRCIGNDLQQHGAIPIIEAAALPLQRLPLFLHLHNLAGYPRQVLLLDRAKELRVP